MRLPRKVVRFRVGLSNPTEAKTRGDGRRLCDCRGRSLYSTYSRGRLFLQNSSRSFKSHLRNHIVHPKYMPTKKTKCRKASGLFCTHFSQCNFGRCQTPKMPCGWDLNLNNRLFRGDFAIFQSPGLPFFRLF